MDAQTTLWKIFAGLGLFLVAMTQLEVVLQELAGKSFKRFLTKYASNALIGVFVGALATAILQSSSLVTIIVLAFSGAGIISLRPALGIVFGANLGTTFKGWVIAWIGFKWALHAAAFPLMGVGALLNLSSKRWPWLQRSGNLIFLLGLLLLALEYMQSGTDLASQWLDVEYLRRMPLFAWALSGIIMTVIIQSSSAAMVLNLGFLNTGMITLDQAAAFCVGADLGTTSTAFLGSLTGRQIKRQVALAHIWFNVVTCGLAFMVLHPLLAFIQNIAGVKDPLFALVAYQNVFNVIGILIFLPFTGPFAKFLERQAHIRDETMNRHLHMVPSGVPEAALSALRLEALNLLTGVFVSLQSYLMLDKQGSLLRLNQTEWQYWHDMNCDKRYGVIKDLEKELVSFALAASVSPVAEDVARIIQSYLHATRHLVHSVKSVKDIAHDLRGLRTSETGQIKAFMNMLRSGCDAVLNQIIALLSMEDQNLRFRVLVELQQSERSLHEELARHCYDWMQQKSGDMNEAVRCLNVAREMSSAYRALLAAMKYLYLNEEQIGDFDQLPQHQTF